MLLPTAYAHPLVPANHLQFRLWLLALHHSISDDASLDLASGSLWHVVRKVDLLWHLKLSQLVSNPSLQLLLIELFSRLENNGYTDLLAIHLIRDGEADCLGHSWMTSENVVKLDWTDLLSSLVDELLFSG